MNSEEQMAKKSQAPSTKRINPKLTPKKPEPTLFDTIKDIGAVSLIGAGAVGVFLAFVLSDHKPKKEPVAPVEIAQVQEAPKAESMPWPVIYDVPKGPVIVEAATSVPAIVPLTPSTDPLIKTEVVEKPVSVKKVVETVKAKIKQKVNQFKKKVGRKKRRPVDLDTNTITMNNLRGIPNP